MPLCLYYYSRFAIQLIILSRRSYRSNYTFIALVGTFFRKEVGRWNRPVSRWNPYSRKTVGRWNPQVVFWNLGVRRWKVSAAKNAALESLRVSLAS